MDYLISEVPIVVTTTWQFLTYRDDLNRVCEEVLTLKGEAYSQEAQSSGDRLANFKRAAASAGIDPLQALWVYAQKHFDSIGSWIAAQSELGLTAFQEDIGGEPIQSRIADARNYLDLLWGLVEERNLVIQARKVKDAE